MTTIPQPKIANFPESEEDKPMTTKTTTRKTTTRKTAAAKKEAPKMPAKTEPKTTVKPAAVPAKPAEPKPAPKKGAAIAPTKFNAQGLRGQEWIKATAAMQAEAVALVRGMYGPTPKFMPESLYKKHVALRNGTEPGKLNNDVEQLVALGIAAHDLGFKDNRFIATGQVKNYPGAKIKPGAFEFFMTFPGRWYYVVNVEDVEWPGGKVPESLPEKPKAEPKAQPKAEPKAQPKKATSRKTTTKAKPAVKPEPANALADKLAALKAAGFTAEEIAAVLKAL